MAAPKQKAQRLPFKLVKKAKPGKCPVAGCRNCSRSAGKWLSASPRTQLCSKHAMQVWRIECRLKAVFSACKDKARRRGIPWTISEEQFTRFCERNQYLERRGRKVGSFHIDRRDPLKGYVPGNIRILSVSENCAKAQADKERRAAHVAAKVAGYIAHLDEGAPQEDEWQDEFPEHDPAESSPYPTDDNNPF